jgi:hypothetical protein
VFEGPPLTTMDLERVWSTVARRPLFRVGTGKRATRGRHVFDEAVAVVCLVILVAVTVLGGLLALFHWVAADLPLSLLLRCPEVDGCLSTGRDENQPEQLDDRPEMTR